MGKFRLLACAFVAVLAAGLIVGTSSAQVANSPGLSTLATGLQSPRGLTFGPDGKLYVAEGGLGGTQTTTPQDCQQVPPPVGPYSGGFTSRISRIDPRTGARSTVVDHLPSSGTSPAEGVGFSGVSAVAFIDRTLYALEAGAGCSHGLKNTVNGVLRVHPDGHTTLVADLSRFLMAHPVAQPFLPDFEPDGTWYSMEAVGNRLYVVEPNHGEIDIVTPHTGAISRLVDVSATQGHVVPTSLVRYHGGFLLGNLGIFVPNSTVPTGVRQVTNSGGISLVAAGLTGVTGVAVRNGRIYALESFSGAFAPIPGTEHSGTVVRLNPRTHAWETIVRGLEFPTAMTFDDRGDLFISNKGFGQGNETSGEVVKVDLSHMDD